MSKTEGKGVLIYGDRLKDSVPVTWKLRYGKELSNEESWRAGVTVDIRDDPKRRGVDADILLALKRQFIFKLQTEDGSVYPCGIYSLDDFSEYGAGIYPFIICSRDQPMEYLE